MAVNPIYKPIFGKPQDTGLHPNDLLAGAPKLNPKPAVSPYTTFVGQNKPSTSVLSNIPNAIESFQGAAPKSVDVNALAQSYQGFQPKAVDVGRVQNLPAEYYQQQIEDLSAPITQQYDKARAATRGDLAARGTLYDSEAFDPRVSTSIGALDENYLRELGNITKGVQLNRMTQENANEAEYQRRLQEEGSAQRSAEADYLKSLLGEGSAQRSAELQRSGLDVNFINSLLGFGADTYGTEANLFGDIYGEDVGMNQSLLEDKRLRDMQRANDIQNMLELSGYTEQPQGPLFDAYLQELGYRLKNTTATQRRPEGLNGSKPKSDSKRGGDAVQFYDQHGNPVIPV